jgi:antitoxin (DNA-binding transcriptional repressor) of toxin-antitoxin stability system
MTVTITQAELRDGSDGVMDALEAGEDFIITRNGHPVGELRPIAHRHEITSEELVRRFARIAGGSSSD